ncbi:MAG TPA: YfcE family phosphodiesterase [Spirochaetota bacterium]|nr:YfcE family phosphodiesterase [Spirochaetota bacterium]HPI88758.1 YfcE family phosphodiesterase [Spirochaetota bacterium]HPR47167.1 YfcE family phosphodiesterase [Spirochaetota bacterium]
MIIGIISDTHNNLAITKKALQIFKEKGVELVVHAGDLTSPKMLELFRGFNCKFVLGNGDIDVEELNRASEEFGFGCIEESCTFKAGGKNFILFHGNNVPMFRDAVASGKYDYIIKGHTHFYENYVSNKTRIINPGSLYSSDEYSIALLDTKTDKVDLIRIDEE